jgi:hypothetical protein
MEKPKLNPLHMSVSDAALLLSKGGGEEVTENKINDAISSGAPVDSEGNINLVHLGAWLLKEISSTAKQ